MHFHHRNSGDSTFDMSLRGFVMFRQQVDFARADSRESSQPPSSDLYAIETLSNGYTTC